MAFRIPAEFLGKPVTGSLEGVLSAQPGVVTPPTSVAPATPANNTGIDLARYVILESPQRLYHPMLVSLDLNHHNKNWDQAHAALQSEGAYMLNPKQFADFLNLLRDGSALDGNGVVLDRAIQRSCYDAITEVRAPWRSEWLDAKFSVQPKPQNTLRGKAANALGLGDKDYSITYHVIGNRGTLQTVSEPLDPATLLADKTPGIDIGEWMRNPTAQGLPRADISAGSLYYWHPRDGTVAGFGAGSDGASLDCYRVPQVSNSALGVRPARKKI